VTDAASAAGARVRDSRAVAVAARYRWPLFALLVALSVWNDAHAVPLDVLVFQRAGRHLLSGAWRTTFADPSLQAGPVFLAVYGALRSQLAVSLVVQPLTVAGLVLTVRRARRALGLGPDARAELIAGVVLLALQVPSGAYLDGHPAQVLLPLLWVHAALDAREGRPVRAGLLLALGANVETWALLGVPVLLWLPAWRQRVASVAVAAVAAVAPLLPFLLLGTVRTQEYVWRVEPGVPVAPLVGPTFPWWLRLAQALAAAGAGALAWRLLRRLPEAVWAVPLAVVVVRLLLDPILYGYYWLAANALATVAAGVATRRAWPALLGAYAVLLEPLVGVWAAVCLCLAGLALTALPRVSGRPSP
jgi:hypothetical protein